MQWRSKPPVVTKGKRVTLLLLIQVFSDAKIVSSVLEALQLFIRKKIVEEEMCIESNKKAKTLFSGSSGKQKAGRILHPKNYMLL
jgi:hypothetical protein